MKKKLLIFIFVYYSLNRTILRIFENPTRSNCEQLRRHNDSPSKNDFAISTDWEYQTTATLLVGVNSSGLSRPTAKRGELYHAGRKRDNCARPISSARTRQLRDALIKLIPLIEALRLPSSAFNPGTGREGGTVFHGKHFFSFSSFCAWDENFEKRCLHSIKFSLRIL